MKDENKDYSFGTTDKFLSEMEKLKGMVESKASIESIFKMISERVDEKFNSLSMPSSAEQRFNFQNSQHQVNLLSNRLNDVQDLCAQLRNDLFSAVTELDRAGVQRDNIIKEQLVKQIDYRFGIASRVDYSDNDTQEDGIGA